MPNISSKNYEEFKVQSRDISVVIQGPLYNDATARLCITSIRKHLPEAEIILSTWDHTDLEADKIIISNEPPAFMNINGTQNNILKQIISTQNGINAANRSYVLKFRADHQLTNDNITMMRNYHVDLPSNKRFFTQPITITNFFARNPAYFPLLFHISDVIQFGKKEDLLDLWSISLPNENDLILKKNPLLPFLGNFIGFYSFSQVPEQTLLLGWLKKHGFNIHLPYLYYTNYILFKLSEDIISTYFHLINQERSGILFPERFYQDNPINHSVYTEDDIAYIQNVIHKKIYFFRYLKLLLNKYIMCWFKKIYLRIAISLLLYSISPSYFIKLRSWIKSRRKK
jgi:hypothetical protein